MITHRLACVLCLLLAGATRRVELPVPPGGPGATQPATDETVPRDALQEMYRVELGAAYDPVQADQWEDAHALLEKFFAARSAAERKQLVRALTATSIDPNVLGRLCRIRSHWPRLERGGVFYVNQGSGRFVARYFLGVPPTYDRTRSWPLVIKLPDPVEFLTSPPADAQAVVARYTKWINDELSAHKDAIVLMPLVDMDEYYGPSYAGMDRVMQPLFDAAERVNIDPARVYLMGQSLAALGVWYVALDQPTYFAAIESLAGAAPMDWEQVRMMNLRNVLPVVWADDDDPLVKAGFSKTIVRLLRQARVDVDFVETHGMGHTPNVYVLTQSYDVMRKRVRPLYPNQVWLQTNRPDVRFNRADWAQIYQELTTGKEHHAYFRHGTAHMITYENTCSIKAEVHNNQIDVASDNVDTLRFYLNDQMVNLSQPLTVTVNRRQKFKGMVKPSIEQMLSDQLFMGRGWRYYTAAVDIEMTQGTGAATRPATRPAAPRTPGSGRGKITVGPAPGEG